MTRVASLLLAGVLLVGCSSARGTSAAPVTSTTVPSTTSTTTSSTTTTTRPADAARTCTPWRDRPVSAKAASLTKVLAAHLLDPRFAGTRISASVWVDGLGEVLADHPDDRLPVASNEKLLTTAGVLESLPLSATLDTEVRLDPASGNLVLVAGGDPTLTINGPHSLDALALLVRAAGITQVRGGLVVDDTHFDRARTAPGWGDDQVPAYVGPMSAFMVDDNRYRTDPAFLAEPALGNGETFLARLAAVGVTVAGRLTLGTAPASATHVATLASPSIGDLLTRMLLTSDNEIAETLTREAGARLTGVGSTPAGTGVLAERLRKDCAPVDTGGWTDGSGLSHSDVRSARELRRLMEFARTKRWWHDLVSRLPVAGRSGTLSLRFRGTAAEGRVRAKTGTIIGGATLTGALKTASGRRAVFSVLLNGPQASVAMHAVDDLIAALAAS
ncbi:MAG: D-alanyl-D-alanine carboxypeptidase/D-alanyl-D-alanine-endopeptidase [Acidimicrobiia bacterium]|nr:D-alanyl-D-alanine carboxypeptidase/D-alanyl-D-alanine-endopeptidase [Acidimicrobiia bacterium]